MIQNSNNADETECVALPIFDEDRGFYRPTTAPARPLSEIEEFRRSKEFYLLEQAVLCSAQLIHRNNQKYDLDSFEGQTSCKRYLKIIEKLQEAFKAQTASRRYRTEFSRAYKILYKEGALCYLTEILDSAQEAFPYLWVNGEKYIFSNEVLESGRRLFFSFCKIQHVVRNLYARACQDSAFNTAFLIRKEMCRNLEEFDVSWVTFEQLYVLELMLIEGDARRFITDAIETEKELQHLEIREKAKGKIFLDFAEYHEKRDKLAKQIAQLNSVANTEGKGRDDLSVEILLSAEGLMRRISPDQSRAVRALAERVRNSFLNIRALLRKYAQNIEIVDPQLKNNAELVEALVQYETSWEKGKKWFIQGKKCTQLIHFSQILEATSEKYQDFAEQIEYRDADIFVSIPALLILKSLEDNDKGICRHYLPNLGDEKDRIGSKYKQLDDLYQKHPNTSDNKHYEYYNYTERLVLNLPNKQETSFTPETKKDIESMVHLIKQLSIELQRANPSEWNDFLDVVLGSEQSQETSSSQYKAN